MGSLGLKAALAACLLTLGAAQLSGQEVPTPARLDAYTPAEAQNFLEHGIALLEAGDLDAAQVQFSRAIQSLRVAKGLRSQEQLRPIEQLLWALMRAGRWQQLDANLEHYYWLVGHSEGAALSSHLAITANLRQLYLEAAAHPTSPAPARYLSAAQRVNWQTISFIESNLGADSRALLPWLYQGVLLQYIEGQLADRRGLSNYQYKTDGGGIVSGWSLSNNEVTRASYAIGVSLLDRIEGLLTANRDEDAAGSERTLLLRRADWERLNGNDEAAAALYAEADSPVPPLDDLPRPHLMYPAGSKPQDCYALAEGVALGATRGRSAANDEQWSDRFPGVSVALVLAFQSPCARGEY